jgi:hypothetical protein
VVLFIIELLFEFSGKKKAFPESEKGLQIDIQQHFSRWRVDNNIADNNNADNNNAVNNSVVIYVHFVHF